MPGSRSSKTDWQKTVERAVSRPLLMGLGVCHAVLVVRAESVQEVRLDILGTRSRWSSSQCSEDLSGVPGVVAERRQVLDLPEICLLAQEHQIEAICCPNWHTRSLGSFPASVAAPVQYGPNMQALAVYLPRGNCSLRLAPARLSQRSVGARSRKEPCCSGANWQQSGWLRRSSALPS